MLNNSKMKKLFRYEVQQRAEKFLRCGRIEDFKSLGMDVNQVIYQAMHPRYYTFEMRKKMEGFVRLKHRKWNSRRYSENLIPIYNLFILSIKVRQLMDISFG